MNDEGRISSASLFSSSLKINRVPIAFIWLNFDGGGGGSRNGDTIAMRFISVPEHFEGCQKRWRQNIGLPHNY